MRKHNAAGYERDASSVMIMVERMCLPSHEYFPEINETSIGIAKLQVCLPRPDLQSPSLTCNQTNELGMPVTTTRLEDLCRTPATTRKTTQPCPTFQITTTLTIRQLQ